MRSAFVMLAAAALLSFAPLTAGLAQQAEQASGDAFVAAPGGWQTYVNARYGTRFDFPASVFTPDAPPANGDGRSFSSPDAKLELYSSQNIDRATAASTRQSLIGAGNYRDVTYSPTGRDWLVLSGYRGDRVFYEKYFFKNGVISGFGVEFPRTRKPYYAPMVERMEDSFRAGRSD